MSKDDRRRAERVPFCAPICIAGPRGRLEAEIRDLSCTGVRFRLKAEAFPEPPQDLMDAARRLKELIGSAPTAQLRHDLLGPLVSRKVIVTRIVLPLDVQSAVDVGCRFDRPLTSDETGVLGVALAPERDGNDGALPRADTSAPATRQTPSVRKPDFPFPQPRPEAPPKEKPPEPVRATVEPQATPAPTAVSERHATRPARFRTYVAGKGQSIQCESTAISPQTVNVRVKRQALQVRGVQFEERDLDEIVAGLVNCFGKQVRLKVADRGKHLWSGPARVNGIELPKDRPNTVVIEYAFERPLNPSERKRVGL